tara:strand:+ start:3936 stop:5768 length:1833 start_codon:yes stop_codon:yes gene_type:complete
MSVRLLSQFGFDGGEVSPKFAGNSDLERYQRSLALCENIIVLPQGILTRRPGTRFIAEVKDSSKRVRLVPFEYSADDTYMLEFGDSYVRFYRADDEGNIGVIRDGSDAIYEVTTPYDETEIFGFDYQQVEDTLYLTHPAIGIATLTRTDHANWAFNSSPTITDKPAEWTGTNWPAYITEHQQRLVLAATPAKQRKMWVSMTPNTSGPRLLTFTTGTGDENALVFNISAKGAIAWLASGRALYLGTTDEARTVSGAGGFYEPITPSSILNRDHANDRSAAIKPVRKNNSFFFLSKSQKRVHEFNYSFEDDAFNAPDITEWAEHIAGAGKNGKITKLAIARDPVPIIWGVRGGDGQLVAMTYKENSVYAWTRHKIGGSYGGNDWGKVEDIGTVFMDGRDVLWIQVVRTINEQTVRYLEILEDFHDPENDTDIGSARYLDSAISHDAETAFTTFDGLAHLMGEDVELLADGAALPAVTVTDDGEGNGVIELPDGIEAVELVAGLNAPFYAQTLPIDPGSAQGSGRSKKKRVTEASLDLLNTSVLQIGKNRETLRDASFMTTQTLVGDLVPMFTGIEALSINDVFDEDGTFGFGGDGPLPCNIRAFVQRITTGD